jgi:uncharacterized membrane protein YczE
VQRPSIRDRFDLRAAAPRLPRLVVGVMVFGTGIAMMVQAGLGLGPWEALNQGIARQSGLAIGTVSILLGIPILALWWPLGERPGIGTLLNVVLVGLSTNAALTVIPVAVEPWAQLALMAAGVATVGLGSGLYLGADLGPGPRDGLMTGLHRRTGWSIRRARTTIELTVLVIGWALGGTIGLGTVVFAVGIGPLVQAFLKLFDRDGRLGRRRRASLDAEGAIGE